MDYSRSHVEYGNRTLRPQLGSLTRPPQRRGHPRSTPRMRRATPRNASRRFSSSFLSERVQVRVADVFSGRRMARRAAARGLRRDRR